MSDPQNISGDDRSSIYDLLEQPGQPWRQQAACRGSDPNVFFPGTGESTRPAQEICATCPVRAECLAYALKSGEKFGIFGGLSERQRRKLRRDERKRAACGTDSGYYGHRYRSTDPCPDCLRAHAAATAAREAGRVRLRRKDPARRRMETTLWRTSRLDEGWCAPCARSEHHNCHQGRCTCPKHSARLAVDHAVTGPLENGPVAYPAAGVENGKGWPAGRSDYSIGEGEAV